MTEAPDRAALQKMKVADLRALAGERGLTLTGSEVKAQLVHMLTPVPLSEIPADVVTRRDVDSPLASRTRTATRDDLLAAAKRFIDQPNALDQALLHEWMEQATPGEYDQLMREATGTPEPAAAGPAGEARVEAVTALEKWHEAAEGAEIEPYRPSTLPGDRAWSRMQEIAGAISSAVALPVPLRNKPADVLLLLLTGHDVGLHPTTALNKIHVIEGRPSMSAEVMRALVLHQEHVIFPEVVGPDRVVMVGRRKGWRAEESVHCEWTLERAATAQLTGKDVWKKYPEAMLTARATAELCRLIFPDVLAGVSFTPEELDADVDAGGAPIQVPSTATTESGPELTPEEESQAAGWESRAAEGTAHRALRERVQALTEDQRATAKQMQESSGWPIRPKKNFDAFVRWVETCEKSNVAEGRPPETTEERAAAARAVLAEAEQKAGVHVSPDGPWGAEKIQAPLLSDTEDALQVCGECGGTGPTEMTITHEEGCSEDDII